MDSVQVGKAVLVKVSFASLGFEPRTFSYTESCATNTLPAKKYFYAVTVRPGRQAKMGILQSPGQQSPPC